ncbi:hypothetical protein PSQ90_07815 [Devosia rhodophyticola]|uniref:Uncharacterized protein n=1 Tax=Devosia rhodophyticola TaxID=3026423 RepID=A0ABY7Z2J3_9HYPH|nr:hypothetical protein [Devosia rhodophyticola]WDR07314.1 hypothetical protein PSQ90_07815 [Devosia rhodophyticola]
MLDLAWSRAGVVMEAQKDPDAMNFVSSFVKIADLIYGAASESAIQVAALQSLRRAGKNLEADVLEANSIREDSNYTLSLLAIHQEKLSPTSDESESLGAIGGRRHLRFPVFSAEKDNPFPPDDPRHQRFLDGWAKAIDDAK